MTEPRQEVVVRVWMCGAVVIANWCFRYMTKVTSMASEAHQSEFVNLNNTLNGILGDDARIAREDRDGRRLIEHHVNRLKSNHNRRVAMMYNLGFNRLFKWSCRVSSQYMQREVEIGQHMRISGDEHLQVPIGTYVHLRREQRVSVVDDDCADEYISVYAQGVAMNGVSVYAIDRNIQWVVPTDGGVSQSVHIGRLRGANVEHDGDSNVDYDGVVAMIWKKYMDRDDSDDEQFYDEDDISQVLYYDAVIVGSSQVFQYAEWDRLYYPMSEWVRNGCDLPGLSKWVKEFRGEFHPVEFHRIQFEME